MGGGSEAGFAFIKMDSVGLFIIVIENVVKVEGSSLLAHALN